jgi:hypothetical protein
MAQPFLSDVQFSTCELEAMLNAIEKDISGRVSLRIPIQVDPILPDLRSAKFKIDREITHRKTIQGG